MAMFSMVKQYHESHIDYIWVDAAYLITEIHNAYGDILHDSI